MPFDNGETFVVELPDGQGSEVIRAGRGEALVETSADTFEAGLSRVRHMAEALLERLTDLPRKPDRVGAGFGVTLTTEAGLVVTKVSGDAHITIELEWSSGRPEGQG